MKVLFDNNTPVGIRRFLQGHTVFTALQLGWDRLRNGKLLTVAEENGFDVMVTADQNIKNEQNLIGRKIAIVTLGTNDWPLLKARGTEIAKLVNEAKPGGYYFLEFPEGHKRSRTRQ